MLTLTRKAGEEIVIIVGNYQIDVLLKEIRKSQVRIGIATPKEVLIYRREVWERIRPR